MVWSAVVVWSGVAWSESGGVRGRYERRQGVAVIFERGRVLARVVRSWCECERSWHGQWSWRGWSGLAWLFWRQGHRVRVMLGRGEMVGNAAAGGRGWVWSGSGMGERIEGVCGCGGNEWAWCGQQS